MTEASQRNRALLNATLVGTVLQIAMVTAGHSVPAVKTMFAAGGMGISLVAGVLYAVWAADGSKNRAAVRGAVAGGVCAVLGIGVSYLLGDVQAQLLALGTASSCVTGALGGVAGALKAAPSRTERA
jgi:hypothetical protein